MAKRTFIQQMKDPATHELIAFGWAGSYANKPFYTIRDSIVTAMNSPELQAECPEVFGQDFASVVTAIQMYADLDKKYFPNQIF